MDEEYILRWNDHGISFFALAEDLLQQELLTDVTVWCGDRVFDAHRLVLCACSPLFRAMLTRTPPRLSRSELPIVFLRDVSPVHFERLLQFMYCGEVRVPNNELEDLLATATSLKVRGLANTHERSASAGTAASGPTTASSTGGGSGIVAGPPPPPLSPSALLTAPPSRLNQQPPPISSHPPLVSHHHQQPLPSSVPNFVAASTAAAGAAVSETTNNLQATSVRTPPPPTIPSSRLEDQQQQHRQHLHHHHHHHHHQPAAPPKKRRLSRDGSSKKFPLSTLDGNRILKSNNSTSATTTIPIGSNSPSLESIRETAIKEEDEPVSPPPQAEPVPLISEQVLASSKNSPPILSSSSTNNSNSDRGNNSSSRLSETQRILPPSEPRKTGTCYFCKKSFMKNKQLMNHVCPKKPRGGSSNSSSTNATSKATSAPSP